MSLEGLIRSFLDQSLITGINIATTGVLFRKALMPITGGIILNSAAFCPFGNPKTFCETQFIPPVWVKPVTTIYSTATVTIPGLLNPARASCSLKIPLTNKAAVPPKNTTSAERLVRALRKKTPTVMAIVVQACQLRLKLGEVAK